MIVTIEVDDGGPAFPSTDTLGMSLRDYFAAKAMQKMKWEPEQDYLNAEDCYRIADAMIESRNGKNKLLSYSVVELNLDLRTLNCLRAENIKTIGELCDQHTYRLKKVPNLGKKCLKNIVDALAKHGLKLKS